MARSTTLIALGAHRLERFASRRRIRAERASDLAIATAALVVTLPLALASAAAVKLEGGPLLFRQRRLGQEGQEFTMLKFRTMKTGASEQVHVEYIAQLCNGELADAELKKLTEDPRVTRVGRWLRRLSLDELPQLVNVLRGEMSVVGPRPALAYELEFYSSAQFERFAVRPGLTGLWQVCGRNRLGFHEMLDLDVEYVRRKGFLLDLKILLKTPAAMLRDAA